MAKNTENGTTEATEVKATASTPIAAKAKGAMTAAELRLRVMEIIAGYLQNSDVRETQKSVAILNAVAADVQSIEV